MGRTAATPGLGINLTVQVAKKQRPDQDARIDAHVRVRASAAGPRDRVPAVDIALVVAVDVTAERRDAAVAALAGTVGALPDGLSYTVLGGGGGSATRCAGGGRWPAPTTGSRPRSASAGSPRPPRGGPRPDTPPGWPQHASSSPNAPSPYGT